MVVKKARIWLVVVALVAATTSLPLLFGAGEEPASDEPARRIPVVLGAVGEHEFIRGVKLAGDVRAVDYALVSARIPGTLDEILVDEGDEVVAGETVLFRTDSANLESAVEVAAHDEAVAAASVREAEANLKRIQAGFAQVEADLARYRRLVAKGAATAHQLETMETQHREATANLEHAHAVIDLARARQSQAASRKSIAAKNLEDSVVKAPVSGRVVERLREPGEMAGAGTPVLRIESLDRIEVSAFLPGEHYAEVRPGATRLRARAGATDLGELVLTFRGPVVDPMLRNFEIKARIPNPPAGIVPGRLIHLTIVLEDRPGIGIPRASVRLRGGKSVVFVVRDGLAVVVPIETGLGTNGIIEVTGGKLSVGDEIVVEGQDWLNDGSAVRAVKED